MLEKGIMMRIPYLCKQGMGTLCGLWGIKMNANINVTCVGWYKDIKGAFYYLVWDNGKNKIIEVRVWE